MAGFIASAAHTIIVGGDKAETWSACLGLLSIHIQQAMLPTCSPCSCSWSILRADMPRFLGNRPTSSWLLGTLQRPMSVVLARRFSFRLRLKLSEAWLRVCFSRFWGLWLICIRSLALLQLVVVPANTESLGSIHVRQPGPTRSSKQQCTSFSTIFKYIYVCI